MRTYQRKHTRCIVEGCEGRGCGVGGKYFSKGYCHKHYELWRRNGVPEHKPKRMQRPEIACVIDGCIGTTRRKDGLCEWHVHRKTYYGDPEATPEDMSQAKGYYAENEVGQLLRSYGLSVKRMFGAGGDLLVGYKLKIEVKTASPQVRNGNFKWAFNIHRHGKLNEQCDYYLFRFESVPGCEKPLHALYKAPLGVLTVAFQMRKMLYSLAPALQLFEDLREGKLTQEDTDDGQHRAV